MAHAKTPKQIAAKISSLKKQVTKLERMKKKAMARKVKKGGKKKKKRR